MGRDIDMQETMEQFVLAYENGPYKKDEGQIHRTYLWATECIESYFNFIIIYTYELEAIFTEFIHLA